MMETGWPLHRGFGACCDPAVFNLEGVWSIRQDPDLYKIASTIADEANLWVDVNRSIHKLPGQGDNEFLHYDFNPFARQKMITEAVATVVSHKHHSVIRVGADLIQFVNGSYSCLAVDLIPHKILFPPFFFAGFRIIQIIRKPPPSVEKHCLEQIEQIY